MEGHRSSYADNVRHNANRLMGFILKHKWKIVAGIALFFLYVNATNTISSLLFIVFLIAVAAFSTFYKYWFKLSFGFELVTMTTVVTTILYGAIIGMIVGLISAILAELLPQMIESSSIFWITSVTLSALIVSVMHALGASILAMGLASFAFQMLISEPIRLIGPIEVRMQAFLYLFTGFLWNLFIFTKVAPLLIAIMR
ncbi:MAG: hypothetical protein EPN86_00465 [Nanoarchaeota archaeon]|nr:MAG: hypothetical protein EPN86_00465 [Nanoarchaeota archaeon]